jgi:nuclear GTP-binding protein
LKKVIQQSDVLLEVVDVRDPLGYRNEKIEQLIMSQLQGDGTQKRMIIILNKIDLVPMEITQQWLDFLRKYYPVLAFKSATQQQSSHLNSHEMSNFTRQTNSDDATHRRGALGANALLQLIKNYARTVNAHGEKSKKNLTIGIIGYPNVGKSSIINSLKRARACSVGPTAGLTKALQLVRLDKQVTLIDSPGVIWRDRNERVDKDSPLNESMERLLLRNCINAEEVDDHVFIISILFKYVDIDRLLEIYQLNDLLKKDTMTPDSFLSALGKKMGKLLPAGLPNVDAASRIVLRDLYRGKIPYYTLPPTETTEEWQKKEVTIASQWAREFDVDALLRGDIAVRVETESGESLDDSSGAMAVDADM